MGKKNKELVADRRRRLKKTMVEYMGGKCLRCGWAEHDCGLQAHHVNPSNKSFRLSTGNTRSWEVIKSEANKCVLLCANCHSVIHATAEKKWFDESIIPEYEDLGDKYTKKKEKTVRYCDCGKPKVGNQCLKCASQSREVIDWPSVETLKERVSRSSFSAVGRELGVSDSAVRKRIANHSPE